MRSILYGQGSHNPADYIADLSCPIPKDQPGRLLGIDTEYVDLVDGTHIVGRIAIVLFDQSKGTTSPLLSTYVHIDPIRTPVANYVTPISGLTAENTGPHAPTLSSLHDWIQSNISPNDFICAHDAANDFDALKLPTPARLLDTALLWPHHDGPPFKNTLSFLASHFLRMAIQVPGKPHDCCEDAEATVKLAWLAVQRGMGIVQWVPYPPSGPLHFTTESPPIPGEIIRAFELQESDVLCMYMRGSRAIGNFRPDSDWDFMIVLGGDRNRSLEDVLLKFGNVDVALYGEEVFARMISVQCIYIVDCIIQKPWIYPNKIDHLQMLKDIHAKVSPSVYIRDIMASAGFEYNRKISAAKRAHSKGDFVRCRKQLSFGFKWLQEATDLAQSKWDTLNPACSLPVFAQLQKDLPDGMDWKEIENTFVRKGLIADAYATFKKVVGACKEQHIRSGGFRSEGERIGKVTSKAFLDLVLTSDGDHPVHLVNALRSDHVTVAECAEYFNVRRHGKHPNLILFRYGNDESRPDPVTNQCRSIILDEGNAFDVVAWPFNRFFMYDPATSPPIQPETGPWVADLKMDGSTAILYNYNGEWMVASSNFPDAACVTGHRTGKNRPFADVFWESWKVMGWDLRAANPNFTYMFELCGPDNIIIIIYEKPSLTLIGARDRVTGNEVDIGNVVGETGWGPPLPSFPITSFHDLQDRMKGYARMEIEGFVIRNTRTFQRYKVKNPDYVAVAWLTPFKPDKYAGSRRALLRIILAGAATEVVLSSASSLAVQTGSLSFHEDLRRLQRSIELRCDRVERQCNNILESLRGVPTRQVVDVLRTSIDDKFVRGVAFGMYHGKITQVYPHVIKNCNLPQLEYLLDHVPE